MSGRSSRIRKYMSCFLKICTFWKITILLKHFLGKWLIFVCDFDIIDGNIGCATIFHVNEIYFVSFDLFLEVKSYSIFFVKKLPRLNILSVIAID